METGIVMGATLELKRLSVPSAARRCRRMWLSLAVFLGGLWRLIPRWGGNRAVIRLAYRDTGVNCEKYL